MGRGQPCNDEHNSICSTSGHDEPSDSPSWRRCEDPRGAGWTVLMNPGAREKPEGFQFTFAKLTRGDYSLQVCPLDDVRDAEGRPVFVVSGGNVCTVVAFGVE